MTEMALGVRWWWIVMTGISVFNVWWWWRLRGWMRVADLSEEERVYRRQQLVLAGVFVAVCGFRSVLPRVDLERLVLIGGPLSSIGLSRLLATVAELALVGQWALWLRGMGERYGEAVAVNVSRVVVPLIGLAEISCWYGVVGQAYVGHVVEESIWAIVGLLVVVASVYVWRHVRGVQEWFLRAVLVGGLLYVLYMVMVDVPMYVERWQGQMASGQPVLLGFWEGMRDAWGRQVVSGAWSDWRSEVVWMGLYFSTAVWMSLGLVWVPVGDIKKQQTV